MRIAVLSDLHFVSSHDPFNEVHARRAFFTDAWPSFKKICALIRSESPDLVVSLGDLVDWYSPENRDFALSLMAELNLPWVVTPGNHDFVLYTRNQDGSVGKHCHPRDGQELASQGWEQSGIELGNRIIDAGDTGLILLNSAISDVPEGSGQWLDEVSARHKRNLLFTHVPLNIAPISDYILSVDPDRNMEKYVQSGAPWVFEQCVKGKIDAVYSGHLHFPGNISMHGVEMYILGLSIVAIDQTNQGMGTAMIIDLDNSRPRTISIQ